MNTEEQKNKEFEITKTNLRKFITGIFKKVIVKMCIILHAGPFTFIQNAHQTLPNSAT